MGNRSPAPTTGPDSEHADDALGWRRPVMLASVLGALLAGLAVVLVVVLDNASGGDGLARVLPFAMLVLAALAWRLYRADIERLRSERADLAEEIIRLDATTTELRGALERAQQELARGERVDPLTGIGNERAFSEAITDEWRRAARIEKPLALLLIEIDQFAVLSRQASPESIEACLKAIGTVLKTSARRAGDLAARREGDRFALLYSNCNSGTATTLAKRVHAAVASLHVVWPPALGRELTVSIGVAATTPTMKDKPDQLVADAEDALYAATVAGGNRVDTNWQSARSA